MLPAVGPALAAMPTLNLPVCAEHPDRPPDGVTLTAQGIIAPCYALNNSKSCQCARDVEWHGAPNAREQNLMGSYSVDNVCVQYHRKASSVPDFVWNNITSVEVSGTPSVYAYSEYMKAYRRVAAIRGPHDGEDLSACNRLRLGLGVRFPSNNFYHMLGFAAAAHSALLHFAHMPDAVFVPIGATRPESQPGPLWEYSLRSLTTRSAAVLVEQTQSLLSRRCTCFDLFVAATHSYRPESPTSSSAYAAFRRSSALNARSMLSLELAARRSAQDILFIVRHGPRRVITNEKDVINRALAGELRLRAVAFETIPIVRQLAMVSESSAIVGVHGMALAGYVHHLPSDLRRTACVEIRPKPDPRNWQWTNIMSDLCVGAEVKFFYIEATHAPGCYLDLIRTVNCSTDEGVKALQAQSTAHCALAVQKSLRSFAASSPLNCNVTIEDPDRLARIIARAAAWAGTDRTQTPGG